MRSLLALLIFVASLLVVAGCNKEPEIDSLADVQKASEGKEPHPDSGDPPRAMDQSGAPLDGN